MFLRSVALTLCFSMAVSASGDELLLPPNYMLAIEDLDAWIQETSQQDYPAGILVDGLKYLFQRGEHFLMVIKEAEEPTDGDEMMRHLKTIQKITNRVLDTKAYLRCHTWLEKVDKLIKHDVDLDTCNWHVVDLFGLVIDGEINCMVLPTSANALRTRVNKACDTVKQLNERLESFRAQEREIRREQEQVLNDKKYEDHYQELLKGQDRLELAFNEATLRSRDRCERYMKELKTRYARLARMIQKALERARKDLADHDATVDAQVKQEQVKDNVIIYDD